MRTFQKGNWLRFFLRDPIGPAYDCQLYHDEMRDNFRRRPLLFSGFGRPLFGWDHVCGSEECALRVREFVDDRCKGSHRFTLAVGRQTGRNSDGKVKELATANRSLPRCSYRSAPPACSNAWANCSTIDSPNAGPVICNPTGSFPQIRPQGTEIPGRPASEAVTV